MIIDKVLNPISLIVELLPPSELVKLLKVNNVLLGEESLFAVIAGKVIKVGDKITELKENDVVLLYPTGAVRWNENQKTYMYLTYNEVLAKFEEKQEKEV